jgi:SAM-dependent methyltransferase
MSNDQFGTRFPREATGLYALSKILSGAVIERCVYAVARLGIADFLAECGPMSVDQIAHEVDTSSDALGRVMRLLASRNVFAEDPPGTFALTPISEGLRSDVSWSFRWTFLSCPFDTAATEILHTIRTGESGYIKATGEDFWSYLEKHPGASAEFQSQMRSEARTMSLPILPLFDWTDVRRVVDVGGGQGHVLAAVLRAAPQLHGTLLDLPSATTLARETFERAEVSDRVEILAGDFFDIMPAGADAYILSRVVHDWDDEEVKGVLALIRKNINTDGNLLLMEMVTGEGGQELPLISDVLMLTVFGGGRERSRADFERLLNDCGFRLDEVRRGIGSLALLIASPA